MVEEPLSERKVSDDLFEFGTRGGRGHLGSYSTWNGGIRPLREYVMQPGRNRHCGRNG